MVTMAIDKNIKQPVISPAAEVINRQKKRIEIIADNLNCFKREIIYGLCLRLLITLPDDQVNDLFDQLQKIEAEE